MQPTKAASSRRLHFPLFRGWCHFSTWIFRKLCWKPQKSKVIPTLHIIKDMGKEEITSVQYHHKCRSIFTLKKMLKSIKSFDIWNWAHHGCMMPYTSSPQDQGNSWRTKVGDNLSYSIQSCMKINGSERQQASRTVDACYHKYRDRCCWGISPQVMLSYIHTSSWDCYQ